MASASLLSSFGTVTRKSSSALSLDVEKRPTILLVENDSLKVDLIQAMLEGNQRENGEMQFLQQRAIAGF